MNEIRIVLGLLVAAVLLVTLARRLCLPYPLLLVLGGLLLGFAPGLPAVRMDPNLVFLFFLPLLLFQESWTTSWRDFRANLRAISLLAIGLVLATTVGVAVIARQALPGFSWPAALVLGAIVAPTDEVAAAAVANRLRVPKRLITIIEDESLVNDAISLVLYQMAVGALLSGIFPLWYGVLEFVWVSVGGIGLGLAVGWLISQLARFIREDAASLNTVVLLSPFAAYLPAEALQVSGVLSVVAAGLYLGRSEAHFLSARARLQATGFWEMLVFLLNSLLFILVGLQLRPILIGLTGQPLPKLIAEAAVISLAVVAIRLLWIFPQAYLPRRLIPGLSKRDPMPSWQNVVFLGWTGIRGATSLAAALAMPLTLRGGVPFAQRERIIFLTFGVILVTLVVQGLSLPWLIGWLHLKDDGVAEREEARGWLQAVQAALSKLDQLAAGSHVPADLVEDLRQHYTRRTRRYAARIERSGASGKRDGRQAKPAQAGQESRSEHKPGAEEHGRAYNNLQRDLLAAERQAVTQLRDRGELGDEAYRRIQHNLDLQQERLDG